MYSEIELKYLYTVLTQMVSKENTEEFSENEGVAVLEKHKAKTMRTLEMLMNQMNLMYYW